MSAIYCEECLCTDESCYCCPTCGSAWCDWLGEHPAAARRGDS